VAGEVEGVSRVVWIIYDIVRRLSAPRVAGGKKFGLERVLKVLPRHIETQPLDVLAEKMPQLIDQDVDSVYLFPFCQEDFNG